MKQTLSPVFGWFLALTCALANATTGMGLSSDVSGYVGESVNMDVSLYSGDISNGGVFRFGFDPEVLRLNGVFGATNFEASNVQTDLSPGLEIVEFSLGYSGLEPYTSGPIFSAEFVLVDPSPLLSLPEITYVTISGDFWTYGWDDDNVASLYLGNPMRFTAPITILDRSGIDLPEPGVLSLLAIGLLGVAGRKRKT